MNLATQSARNVNQSQTRGTDARENWALAGVAFDNRAWTAVPHATDAAAYCAVFGVGLDYFSRARVTSRSSRSRERASASNCPERPGAREAAYRLASLDYPATERRFNCYYAEFLPVAACVPTQRWAALQRGRRYRLVSGTAMSTAASFGQHRSLARAVLGD